MELLRSLPQELEVLLKIAANAKGFEQGAAEAGWHRFVGPVDRATLATVLDTHAAYVYQDGEHQLCVRDPVTRDYIVLDDAGVLYVYSSAPQFPQLFRQLGFEERLERLISQEAHWRHVPTASALLGPSLIRELRLQGVAKSGHRRPDRDSPSH